MAGVTNAPFRTMCREMGPGLVYVSEMVMAAALVHGNERTQKMVGFTADEDFRSVQIYGSDPHFVGRAVHELCEQQLVDHIDMNFGCPAKTVNQHRGGAVLLDEPELVGQIVAAVRRAVPAHIPVSAKMRLGFNDDRRAEDCAQAIEAAGASDLVVHARTKAHGYRPPAYWDRIADLRQHVRMPMVANGEIWTVADALRCREVTGCNRIMIGRGMVADPGLALAIAQHGATGAVLSPGQGVAWSRLVGLMGVFWSGVSARVASRHRAGRLKQWLNYMRRVYPEAQQAFDALRLVHDAGQIDRWLQQQGAA